MPLEFPSGLKLAKLIIDIDAVYQWCQGQYQGGEKQACNVSGFGTNIMNKAGVVDDYATYRSLDGSGHTRGFVKSLAI